MILFNDANRITIILCRVTAVPLTVRCMDWEPLPETVCSTDAASERTWTYLQRVSGNGFQFMSLILLILTLQGKARLTGNSEKLTGQ